MSYSRVKKIERDVVKTKNRILNRLQTEVEVVCYIIIKRSITNAITVRL